MPETPTQTTAHGRYEHLAVQREPFLRRAQECASVTVPALFPPSGHDGSSDLPRPWQSLGSRGVNHLSAKLLLALFPPGAEFFRLTLDDFKVDELVAELGGAAEGQDARGEFETALASVARAVVGRIEQVGARSTMDETFRQLLVGGNVLLHVGDRGKPRMHNLAKYVVKRDGEGTPFEIILREDLSPATAPPEVLAAVEDSEVSADKPRSPEDIIPLYTWIRRDGGKWKVHQEAGTGGSFVEGSQGTYAADKSPWLPLRLVDVDGEDYSRSFIEDYLGDLLSYESLSKSIVQYSAQAARVVYFRDPGGTTDSTRFAEADTGEVIDGDAKDITTFSLDSFYDFRIAQETAVNIEKRLEQAFLLMSGIQRAGERVTAEEIRRLANELEEALGGVYSILAEELQRPLVANVMHQMQRRNELPQIPERAVNLQIVTGLEALGRNQDLTKLDLLLSGVIQLYGPEIINDYFPAGHYIQRRAAALSIDIAGAVRTEQQVEEIRQQRMQQALAEKAVGPAAQAAAQNQGEAPDG